MAGNGGQMAEILEEQSEQPIASTTPKPSRKPRGPTPKRPVSGNLDAGDRLRAAIDDRVYVNFEKIADAMVDKTIQGNMAVARLLLEVTGASTPRKTPVKRPSGPSMAALWAAEPPWEGPIDPDDDVGFGGREPEV